ncbi:aldo/keto reductase [Paenibacillus agilis]|uniref:Aldo/keto reductase n=1 Tax=Paenibacillus agilis TaxID=3020863 RepID=A0A559J111_9BACL|nr:aldo/keto reductase [Paenibacillus agilis]TVX93562.1 aldo/keto reductase [Paenibacillus agilis]
MDARRLGHSGLKISQIGIGTWINFSSVEENHRSLIASAMKENIFHFDTADLYGAMPGWSEELLGKTLKDIRRSSYVLATKVCTKVGEMPNDKGLSRKHIMESCDRSLRRLQTDYIDIYYCHRFDPETSLHETMDAFSTLKKQGKILYAGISMWKADQIKEFCELAKEYKVQVIANQLLYNVLQRPSKEVLEVCEQYGVGLVPYSPLAQGLLSGKYMNGLPESSRGAKPYRNKWILKLLEDDQLKVGMQQFHKICNEANIPLIAAAYGWLLSQPNVSGTVSGFSSKEQLDELLSYSFELSENVIHELNEISYQIK